MIERVLQSLQDVPVLVVGDCILDRYIQGQTVRVSREAPVLVVRQETQDERLGGAANVVTNLISLGARVRIATSVGDDRDGDRLLDLLKATGADVSLVARGGSTSVKTRVLAGAYGTVRQQVLRLDQESDAVTPSETWVSDVVDASHKASIVILSDYGQGLFSESLVSALNRSETKLGVDSRYGLPGLDSPFLVKPNVPEALALARPGRVEAAPSELDDLGDEYRRLARAELCLLTRGKHGMSLHDESGTPLVLPAVGDDEVTDVTGAGDTVMASFCLALAAGLGSRNATRLANVCAATVVAHSGAVAVDPAELSGLVARYHVEFEAWDA